MSLSGKVALITGAGHGLGAAYAKALAEAGADVALLDLDLPAAQRVAAEVRRSLALHADVTDRRSVEAAVDATVAHFGGLDIVVNNAGGSRGYIEGADPDEAFQRTVELNLTSAWIVCDVAVEHLRRRGGGRIVNTTSNTALRPPGDVSIAYIAAKAGVIGLTRALARQWGPEGITVNAVAPGLTAHADLRERLDATMLDAMVATAQGEQCLKRPAEAADLAGAVLYLAGPAGAFVTGQVLTVDGGLTFN
ncbi:MAG TPA: SDR family NAD(P)-dependent oxidoreductase [Actinoplanes sp.]